MAADFTFSSLVQLFNISACSYFKVRYLYVQGTPRSAGAQECREAYTFFLLLFIVWKVTADAAERHNICVSHSEASVQAHTNYCGKAKQEGECCALTSKCCVIHWMAVSRCCHLTWQCSSSLESFGAFSQKDKIYMILEREGDCLTYGLEFSLPFKSSLTCNIDSSFKRWKKRWRTRENKVKNNLNYHIGSELQ